jgi:hypothetical protein
LIPISSIGGSADPPMIGGPSLFLVEACRTCHRVCMMHVLHLSHQFASLVGPWIHVLSSPAVERKHTCDPRMEIDFGDLDMDHGSLQWLKGSMGASPNVHMGPNHQPIFCMWLLEALFIMMVEMVCPFAILGGRPTCQAGPQARFSSTLYLHSNRGYVHVEPSYLNQNLSWLAYVISYVIVL